MAVINTEASRVILRTSNASRGQSVLEKCRQLRDLISGRWSDWGSRRGARLLRQDGGRWSVRIGHEHRGGAAVKHFAGLDVSLGETAVCVVDEEGRIAKETRVPSEPEALAAFFLGLGLTLERIGLEACSLAAWL